MTKRSVKTTIELPVILHGHHYDADPLVGIKESSTMERVELHRDGLSVELPGELMTDLCNLALEAAEPGMWSKKLCEVKDFINRHATITYEPKKKEEEQLQDEFWEGVKE